MTYNVFGGTLSLTQSIKPVKYRCNSSLQVIVVLSLFSASAK